MALTFNELRKYMIEKLPSYTDLNFKAIDDDGETHDAIFIIEKPNELKADRYIVIKFNELDGGSHVRHFAIELWICCDELYEVIETKDAMVKMLDFFNRPCAIKEYKKLRFSNDGGTYKNPNIGKYIDKLFFDCNILA